MAKEDYIKKHLVEYIRHQLEQGFELKDIKEQLIKHGYKKKLVDEIAADVSIESIRVKKEKPKPSSAKIKQMSADLHEYIVSLLVDYITKEHEQGYSYNSIRKALMNYGHHAELVDTALEAIEQKDVLPAKLNEETKEKAAENIRGISPGILYGFTLLASLAFITATTITADESLFLVFISFFPTMLSLTVVYVVLTQLRSTTIKNFMPFVAIAAAVVIFVAMLQIKSPLYGVSEPNTILVLNIVLTLLLATILSIFSRLPSSAKPAPKDEESTEKKESGKELPEDEELQREIEKLTKRGENFIEKEEAEEDEKAKTSGLDDRIEKLPLYRPKKNIAGAKIKDF